MFNLEKKTSFGIEKRRDGALNGIGAANVKVAMVDGRMQG